jgi:hypothetical protein
MARSDQHQRPDSIDAEVALPSAIRSIVRYRGFVLIPQEDLTWLIRPERSPMAVLPFRAPASSLTDVKALVDWRLSGRPAA